jgi:sulfite reductase (NADPH) flavoprotein alpha-component
MKTPTLPDSAPFSASQRAWINGYLAGLFSAVSDDPAKPSLGSILFLFGSQTGSSERLAKSFARDAAKAGFEVRAVAMDALASTSFHDVTRLAVITSTYRDGEFPDNAQAFWKFLSNGSAPDLTHVEFAVLALGDRSYVQFCEAGKLLDRRLAELGAKRICDRVDCDVEYRDAAKAWFANLMGTWGATVEAEADDPAEPAVFDARVISREGLNGPESEKETRHIVLAAPGVDYEVGDALSVRPTNCPDLVRDILTASGLSPNAQWNGRSIAEVLTTDFDLRPFLTQRPAGGTSAAELVAGLRPLAPRLYSISSSPKAHPGEIHLTVAVVRYEVDGIACKGVCSTFLADRAESLPASIHPAPHFRLPEDASRDVILIGPGTGIAPFRAFLAERRATGASGRSWLFFGDQRESGDFLYRDELLAFREDGTLHRLDTAFSRDQAEKIYVQTRMLEAAEEFWAWLDRGAFVYVCGDAKRMARDVDAALHRIVETAGGHSAEAAAAFIANLRAGKRYLRDVY